MHTHKKNTYRAWHTFVLLSIHIVTLGTAYTSEKKRERTETKHDASVITVKCIAGLNVAYH